MSEGEKILREELKKDGQKAEMKLREIFFAKVETELDAEVIERLVNELFMHHDWEPEQIAAGAEVRDSLAATFMTVLEKVPPCPTRTRALNALLDARMLANQAITFKGEI